MRDFTDDLRDLRRRLDRGRGVSEGRRRPRPAGRARAGGRPPGSVGRRRARQAGQRRRTRRCKDDIETFDGLAAELDDVELLHELAREEDDESQEPEIAEVITSVSHQLDLLELRSLFTGEHDDAGVHRADQRQGRRRRRPGLERDAAAHVRALGRAPEVPVRAERRVGRRRSRASCRPSSRSPAATPTD